MPGASSIETTVAAIERQLFAEVAGLVRPYGVHLNRGELDRARADFLDDSWGPWVANRMRQLSADPNFAATQAYRDSAKAERAAARERQLEFERAAEQLREHYRERYREANSPARLWSEIAQLKAENAELAARPAPEETERLNAELGKAQEAAAASALEVERLNTERLAAVPPPSPAQERANVPPPSYSMQVVHRDGNNRVRRIALTPQDAASGAPAYVMDVDRDDYGRMRGARIQPAK